LKALRDGGGRIFRIIDEQWPLMDDSNDPDLVNRVGTLKPGEVALLLNVNPATVRKLVAQGRLKAVYAGSQRRFSIAQVRRVLAQQTLGRRPVTRKEISQVVLEWARRRLELPPTEPLG